MDPHKCDAFLDDELAADDCDGKRRRLVAHLTGPWRLQADGTPWCHGTIRRYDNADVGGFLYNGWALWERGNANEPKPGAAD